MLEITRTLPETAEHDLRIRIDRSVSRALVDREFASSLLADPTVLLDDRGCTPQEYLHLRSIHADTLMDFARQAQALFWVGRHNHSADESFDLAAAAAI